MPTGLHRRFGLVSIAAAFTVGAGFLREATLAYWFGAGLDLDSFLVAMTIPQIASVEVGKLAAAVLIPHYISLRLTGDPRVAVEFAARWIRISIALAAGISGACALFRHQLIGLLAPGLSDAGKALAAQLMLWLCAFMVLAVIAQSTKVFLDANRHHLFPALGGSLISLSGVGGLLLAGEDATIYSFVLGLTIGAAGVLSIQAHLTRRLLAGLFTKVVTSWKSDVDIPFQGIGLMALSALAAQGHIVIDRAFASGLQVGTVSAMHYASTVVAVPGAVIVFAIGTVLLPELGKLHAEGQHQLGVQLVSRTIKDVLRFGIPLVVVTAWLAPDIVRVLFQRGTFSAENAAYTASILAWLSPMLVLSALATILTRQMMAANMWRAIVCFSVGTLLLKCLLSALFVAPLGARGLALASVITTTLSVMLRYYIVFRRWRASVERS